MNNFAEGHSVYTSRIIKQLKMDKRSSASEDHPRSIVFAISLKSKTVSRDWNKVQDNLSKTLRSILRNTDPNFQIMVAGHEKPDIEELNHRSVTWLSVGFPPPEKISEYSRDKTSKRKLIGTHLRKKGFAGYFMPLDADDWVHYRFVEYIRSRSRTDAFVIRKGLMLNLSRKEVWLRRGRFFASCGSSAIFHFNNHDFPLTADENVSESPFRIVLSNHTKVLQNLEALNKRHKMINFPCIAWVLGHGDNNTMIKGRRDNGVSAKTYRENGVRIEDWLYEYFKIKEK